MNDGDPLGNINPDISAVLQTARDWLTHEHSLFTHLNLEPVLIGKGKATFAVDLHEDFTDASGNMHGGFHTIIMDSIFGLCVFTTLDEFKPIATINLRSDYLNNAAPGRRVICKSECISTRGDVAYVKGEMRHQTSNDLLATGSGAFLVGTRGIAKGSRL